MTKKTRRKIAAGAIMAAVIRRSEDGGGSTLEIPMFETMAAFVLQEHLAQHSFDPPVGHRGDQRLVNPRNKPLRTADEWISVTINTDPQVRAFLTAIERPDLLTEPRFATVGARAKNVEAWFEVRGAGLAGKTTAEWLDIFGAADIAAMPCHTLETLPEDPHLQAVGLMAAERHPTEGSVTAIRSTIKIDGSYPDPGGCAQPRGWETRGVLAELGLKADEIDRLLDEGAAIATERRT